MTDRNPEELRDADLYLELIEYGIHPVHKAPTYHFRMLRVIDDEGGEEAGTIRLRVGSSHHIEQYAGHIGYAVHPDHRGHKFAGRSLKLLLPLARCLGLDPLWITCDPDNVASRRTLEVIGACLIEVVDVPEDCIIHRSGHPRKCRYRLDTTRKSV